MDFNAAYEQYLSNVRDYIKFYPEQRRGQAHFNVLYVMYPALGNSVRCTEIDPFNDDERLTFFLDFVYDALRRMQDDTIT